jgi:peptidoglycan DL-endopeptidase CwlO
VHRRGRLVRRRSAAVLALVVATAGLVVAGAAPAGAAPRPPAAPGDHGDDGEGGSRSLTEQLDAASRGYLEAQEALARSKQRQQQLTARLQQIDAQLGPQQAAIDQIVAQTYRTGRLGAVTALLEADSSGSLLDRAEALQTIAVKQDEALRDLQATRTEQEQARVAIDTAIRDQQKQVNVMARRKAQAENALKAVNGGQDAKAPGGATSKAVGGGHGTTAVAAPRNSDGSLPAEGCTANDPTTTGCITPRMLHAMQQARAAGFNHYVACFRHQNSGEHPKGRACDFAADKDGFGGVATGSSRDYGNRLANYFIGNSGRLGVLYVIWFERIWLPSSGWKAYTRGNGDPSSDHTNHVHLSVR